MVSNCANPKCAKPLHYLRDGRIFVFDVQDKVAASNGKRTRRIEHFWLCGVCSQTMVMQQSAEGVQVMIRPAVGLRTEASLAARAMAS
jgi:uncharacterized protein YcsI (UPF0317 family)